SSTVVRGAPPRAAARRAAPATQPAAVGAATPPATVQPAATPGEPVDASRSTVVSPAAALQGPVTSPVTGSSVVATPDDRGRLVAAITALGRPAPRPGRPDRQCPR